MMSGGKMETLRSLIVWALFSGRRAQPVGEGRWSAQ